MGSPRSHQEELTQLRTQIATLEAAHQTLTEERDIWKASERIAIKVGSLLFTRATNAEAQLRACQQAHQRLREAVAYPLAQLRHAYAQLHGKRVSRRGMQQFADGLIAPQIRRLEAALGSTDVGDVQDAGLGTDTQRSGSGGIVRGQSKELP